MVALQYIDPESTCGFKGMKVGKGQWYVNMDIGHCNDDSSPPENLLRLAFPNSIGDLTEDFNMPTHSICEA